MAAGAALVLILTHFAATLGARLSGVLSMFPVMASVLAAFSHNRGGPWFAVHLLHGMLLGYYAFAAFCLTLHLALTRVGMITAFMMAFVTAALVQMATRLLLQRRAASQQTSSSS